MHTITYLNAMKYWTIVLKNIYIIQVYQLTLSNLKTINVQYSFYSHQPKSNVPFVFSASWP